MLKCTQNGGAKLIHFICTPSKDFEIDCASMTSSNKLDNRAKVSLKMKKAFFSIKIQFNFNKYN
jgi:hypothetical protein